MLIEREKLEEITRIINQEAQPSATEGDVEAWLENNPRLWQPDDDAIVIAFVIIADVWGDLD